MVGGAGRRNGFSTGWAHEMLMARLFCMAIRTENPEVIAEVVRSVTVDVMNVELAFSMGS